MNSIQSTIYLFGGLAFPFFFLEDRELADRTAEQHLELTVVWKLDHIPWGGRGGLLCLETQPREKALVLNWNQDSGVEGHALTPFCENTRITTSCWTIIDRKTLGLTKKDTPHPKTKEKPQ